MGCVQSKTKEDTPTTRGSSTGRSHQKKSTRGATKDGGDNASLNSGGRSNNQKQEQGQPATTRPSAGSGTDDSMRIKSTTPTGSGNSDAHSASPSPKQRRANNLKQLVEDNDDGDIVPFLPATAQMPTEVLQMAPFARQVNGDTDLCPALPQFALPCSGEEGSNFAFVVGGVSGALSPRSASREGRKPQVSFRAVAEFSLDSSSSVSTTSLHRHRVLPMSASSVAANTVEADTTPPKPTARGPVLELDPASLLQGNDGTPLEDLTPATCLVGLTGGTTAGSSTTSSTTSADLRSGKKSLTTDCVRSALMMSVSASASLEGVAALDMVSSVVVPMFDPTDRQSIQLQKEQQQQQQEEEAAYASTTTSNLPHSTTSSGASGKSCEHEEAVKRVLHRDQICHSSKRKGAGRRGSRARLPATPPKSIRPKSRPASPQQSPSALARTTQDPVAVSERLKAAASWASPTHSSTDVMNPLQLPSVPRAPQRALTPPSRALTPPSQRALTPPWAPSQEQREVEGEEHASSVGHEPRSARRSSHCQEFVARTQQPDATRLSSPHVDTAGAATLRRQAERRQRRQVQAGTATVSCADRLSIATGRRPTARPGDEGLDGYPTNSSTRVLCAFSDDDDDDK